VSEILETASVHTVGGYEGERPNTLEAVVKEQVQAVFGNARKVLSRPLVEVDDAKSLAQFFRGSSEWPLADSDAVMLGVDTSSREITDTGWCREFIDTNEAKTAVDVKTILQQTRTANGTYRGTPQESIAALLITLATSNEKVALKHDTDYVTDPPAIGRQVRTKGNLTSLQVRFGVDTPNPKEIRTVVSTILGDDPDGSDPDAWVAELASWVDTHSVLVKRTFKGVSREFDVSLDDLQDVLQPAYSGEKIDTSRLTDEEIQSEAETFAEARHLFATEDGQEGLWKQFTEVLEQLEEWYSSATITSRMQETAASGSVPTKETVTSRLADATAHRVDELSTQYHRITGERIEATDPEEITSALTPWVSENEATMAERLATARETFEEISLDSLESLFEAVWNGEKVSEGELVTSTVGQQSEEYETARELLDGDPSLWSQLQSAHDSLQTDYPESPTTESIASVLESGRLPTVRRVEQLIEEAENPRTGGGVWADLQVVADDLRQELPNATLTDEITRVVDAEDRPTDERATELLDEAEILLGRIKDIRETLDGVDDGSLALVEEKRK